MILASLFTAKIIGSAVLLNETIGLGTSYIMVKWFNSDTGKTTSWRKKKRHKNKYMSGRYK